MVSNHAAGSLGSQQLDDVRAVLTVHVPETAPTREMPRSAAVAMVLRDGPSGDLEALFIQRAEHPDDPWSGQMAFPGGRFEPYDASLKSAARRETLEEVGLELASEMLLGRLNDVAGGRLSKHSMAVASFVFHHPEPEVRPNYEVANTVWVPLSYLGDPSNIDSYVFPLDPLQRTFPAFRYEGYVIWGLTYRIVGNFMRLFGVHVPGEPDVTDVE